MYAAALAGLRELPVNVVVSVSTDIDPASLGPQPRNVLVERYLPHAALLGHCTAVISHAGAATLLATYRHGLPQLFLPQGADQFDNAEACVRAGAALSLIGPEVDAHAVAAAAMRLITEPRFTTAARRIQGEIQAMPSAQDVLAELLTDAPVPVDGR